MGYSIYRTHQCCCCFVFSPFCRLLVGFIVRLKIFDPPTKEQMYDDEDFWEVRSQLLLKREVRSQCILQV